MSKYKQLAPMKPKAKFPVRAALVLAIVGVLVLILLLKALDAPRQQAFADQYQQAMDANATRITQTLTAP